MQRSLEIGALIGRFRLELTDQRGDAVRKLEPMPLSRLADHLRGETPTDLNSIPKVLRKSLHRQYLEDDVEYQKVARRHQQVMRQFNDAKRFAKKQKVTALREREKPRETFVLERGVWDAKGTPVERGVLPAVLSVPDGQVGDRKALVCLLYTSPSPRDRG